jgi:hypothetical protein
LIEVRMIQRERQQAVVRAEEVASALTRLGEDATVDRIEEIRICVAGEALPVDGRDAAVMAAVDAARRATDQSDRADLVVAEQRKSPPMALLKVGAQFTLTTSEIDTDQSGRERITPANSVWKVVERQLLADATMQYSVTCKTTGAWIHVLHGDLSKSGFREVPTVWQGPFDAALAALTLASLDGGEMDIPIYKAALTGLRNLRDGVLAYDQQLDDAEIAPTGDDYNRLLALSGLAIPLEQREALLSARTSALIGIVEPPIHLFEQSLHDADFMKRTAQDVLLHLEQGDGAVTLQELNAIHGVLTDALRRHWEMGVANATLENAISAVEEEASVRGIELTPKVRNESDLTEWLRICREPDPRPVVPLDVTRPLFDVAGREHSVASTSSMQVVTSASGVFGVWDRRTGESLQQNCEGTRLANKPPEPEWLARRRQAAEGLLFAGVKVDAAASGAKRSRESEGPAADLGM